MNKLPFELSVNTIAAFTQGTHVENIEESTVVDCITASIAEARNRIYNISLKRSIPTKLHDVMKIFGKTSIVFMSRGSHRVTPKRVDWNDSSKTNFGTTAMNPVLWESIAFGNTSTISLYRSLIEPDFIGNLYSSGWFKMKDIAESDFEVCILV